MLSDEYVNCIAYKMYQRAQVRVSNTCKVWLAMYWNG